MAPRIDQIETDQVIPKRVDVVIIGGGIVGVCTAMFLAEKGVSVALCEKGHIAGEQSSRNVNQRRRHLFRRTVQVEYS